MPATDITSETHEPLDPGTFELIQSMIIEERMRQSTESVEACMTKSAHPANGGFAIQKDKESYDFGAGTPS